MDSRSSPIADDLSVLPAAVLRVKIARDVAVRNDGRWLAGGMPFRVLRLSDIGATFVRRWLRGDVIGEDVKARALARRLLDGGILLSDGCESSGETGIDVVSDVDVIVPVHNRTDQLERCLAALAAVHAHVTVVGDGSSDPDPIAGIAERHDATIARLEVSRGPAAARNVGLRTTSRPFVVFVDSDVEVVAGSLQRLLGHFADPLVAITAPRVLPAFPGRRGWVAGYENNHSALDMGAVEGDAGPGRPVPYVISATMVARRSAIGTGFVEALSSGEDVDLGWRVAAAGWRVVYDPSAVVLHDHRVRLIPLLRKRWTYGRSVGPLARRHPGSLTPLRANAVTVAALAAGAAGLPATAAGLIVGRAAGQPGNVRNDCALTVGLTQRELWSTTVGVSRAIRRAWSPAFLLAACTSKRARRVLLLTLVVRLCEADRLRPWYLPLAALDDFVAALALWSSCIEEGVLDPLLPRIRL